MPKTSHIASHRLQPWAGFTAALIIALASNGCGTAKHDLEQVWIGEAPPTSMAAPDGFMVSPYDAYRAVVDSRRISQKHRWAFFRDDEHYYVMDTFTTKGTAKNAQRLGVRVNGRSGQVE
jgi:hypothetical protein